MGGSYDVFILQRSLLQVQIWADLDVVECGHYKSSKSRLDALWRYSTKRTGGFQ